MNASDVNFYDNDESNEKSLRIIRLEEKVKKLEIRLENITKILWRLAERNEENSSVLSKETSEEYQMINKFKENNETSFGLTKFPESGRVKNCKRNIFLFI